jgi:hypothetical protein
MRRRSSPALCRSAWKRNWPPTSRTSALYRADQHSYLLYPARELAAFADVKRARFDPGPRPGAGTAANDNIMRTGAAASKIYGGYPDCPVPTFNVSGCGQAFTPTVGVDYEFSGWSYVSSADVIPGTSTCSSNRLIAKIVFFNAASGGAEIGSNEVVLGDFDTALDQWIPFSISAPAPTGALRVEALLLYLQPGCDGGAVFVDDLSFSALPASPAGSNVLANPSFSGNLTGWTTFGNVYYDGRAWARRTPTGGAKMFSTFDLISNTSGMYQEFAATPGSNWQLDVYVMTTCMETPILGTNTNTVVARIVFLDAGDVEVGFQDATILDNTAPLGTWTKHSVIVNGAPAGTAKVRPYILFVSPAAEGGAAWVDDIYFGGLIPTGVGDTPAPVAFQLQPNVPNPFGQSTRIDFDLDASDDVNVAVYDVKGSRVATLLDARVAAGPHSVTWDGRSANGRPAPSGIYWCVLKTPAGQTSRRMLLLR